MENQEEITKEFEIIGNNLTTEIFNDAYFDLHKHIINKGSRVLSRNGNTFELLNFKTEIKNPIARCVGGKERNINIFFLLAESLWIWCGRRDVKFLEMFNSQIKEYSDDGVYFHAPYGWRLRQYGLSSMDNYEDSNKHALSESIDQIRECLIMLDRNKEDRRVVAQIWNADLDLNKKSKDLPCNDMLMWKIRDNKLFVTIQNRSNDLDWGLCTNVFQFSFINEIMARILGVGIGSQIHNSQSLHLYDFNPLTRSIEENESPISLYDKCSTALIDFDFGGRETINEKLNIVDFWIKSIITKLLFMMDGVKDKEEDADNFSNSLFAFSEYLWFVYQLLSLYVQYKNKEISRIDILTRIKNLSICKIAHNTDLLILALNFFVFRINKSNNVSEEENNIVTEILSTIDENIGKY